MDEGGRLKTRTLGLLLGAILLTASCGNGARPPAPSPPLPPKGDTPSDGGPSPEDASVPRSGDAGPLADLGGANPAQLWLFGVGGSESNLALADTGPPAPY